MQAHVPTCELVELGGCGGSRYAKGLCERHYAKQWRERNPGYFEEYNLRRRAEGRPGRKAADARWWAANRDKKRLYRQRRKALERAGRPSSGVSHREIAERDGWRCHICRKRVTEAEWSLDHLIPLSAGGSNTAENVALAHHRCNSRRGAGRIPAQLRLIG